MMRAVRTAGLSNQSQRQTVVLLLAMIAMLTAIVDSAEAVVRRRLNVNSNPPGALVYVDNQQIGTTPCSVDFVYYGTREIRLIKPGFETLTVNQPIPTPWYEIPGLDFISENLVATKIRDNRTVTYNLAPQLIVPTPELLDRANQLRQDTFQYGTTVAVTPALAPAPGPVFTPGPPVALPPVTTPEQLPGINPPPFNQPMAPQPVPQAFPAAPPGGAPLLPPRM
jgi:PEGA domain